MVAFFPSSGGLVANLKGEIDWRVLAFSAGVCLVSTLLFGLVSSDSGQQGRSCYCAEIGIGRCFWGPSEIAGPVDTGFGPAVVEFRLAGRRCFTRSKPAPNPGCYPGLFDRERADDGSRFGRCGI